MKKNRLSLLELEIILIVIAIFLFAFIFNNYKIGHPSKITGAAITPTEYGILAGTNVIRSFSSSAIEPNAQLNVTLAVTIGNNESYYAIDETIPAGFSILNYNSGDISEPGHIKWMVLSNAVSTSYSYVVSSNTSGNYRFGGSYMIEGMANETYVQGSTDVAVNGICAPSAEACDGYDNNCDGTVDEGCGSSSGGSGGGGGGGGGGGSSSKPKSTVNMTGKSPPISNGDSRFISPSKDNGANKEDAVKNQEKGKNIANNIAEGVSKVAGRVVQEFDEENPKRPSYFIFFAALGFLTVLLAVKYRKKKIQGSQ